MGLFLTVAMPVIGAFNAPNGMTENALSNIWSNACTTYKTAGSAAKVVELPMWNRHLGIKGAL